MDILAMEDVVMAKAAQVKTSVSIPIKNVAIHCNPGAGVDERLQLSPRNLPKVGKKKAEVLDCKLFPVMKF
ncbi:hypothetical protein V6N13_058722 [Hibiscus sabdariffa]|uniref:Uncharacterized protein n=1 Tax=Hibiscus sabdariffa TaxID=183260 RepID=A0ABR2GF90_9ROSI